MRTTTRDNLAIFTDTLMREMPPRARKTLRGALPLGRLRAGPSFSSRLRLFGLRDFFPQLVDVIAAECRALSGPVLPVPTRPEDAADRADLLLRWLEGQGGRASLLREHLGRAMLLHDELCFGPWRSSLHIDFNSPAFGVRFDADPDAGNLLVDNAARLVWILGWSMQAARRREIASMPRWRRAIAKWRHEDEEGPWRSDLTIRVVAAITEAGVAPV